MQNECANGRCLHTIYFILLIRFRENELSEIFHCRNHAGLRVILEYLATLSLGVQAADESINAEETIILCSAEATWKPIESNALCEKGKVPVQLWWFILSVCRWWQRQFKRPRAVLSESRKRQERYEQKRRNNNNTKSLHFPDFITYICK